MLGAAPQKYGSPRRPLSLEIDAESFCCLLKVRRGNLEGKYINLKHSKAAAVAVRRRRAVVREVAPFLRCQ